MRYRIWSLFGFIGLSALAYAQEDIPKWISDGPYIVDRPGSTRAPLNVMGTKLYVEVGIGGKPRRFVVDTGSPSMIDSAIAKELGLEIAGKSQGKDSHGVLIESDIVQATMTLGGLTIHNVPMFSADFSATEALNCFIGDGVLGSEVLPLGAWRFDLQNSVLLFNTDIEKLPFLENSAKLKLYDFGYPHAPILDVQFAKQAKSKAMFDTGSPAYFAISAADFEGAMKAGGIGRFNSGFGSPGSSLGGQAPNSSQLQAELKTLAIGTLELGRVDAIRRESSPSLIGMGMLERFIVTFDSNSESAYFSRYSNGQFARPSFGFTMAFDKSISVALVWDNTPASAVGLRAGLPLTKINGVETELSCEGIRRAIESMEGENIELEWEGGSAKLSRKTHILQD